MTVVRDEPTPGVIGPFEVETDEASVSRFRASLSGTDVPPDRIPHTFPMCWLTRAELRAVLTAKPGLLIHSRQSLRYHEPLTVNTRYRFTARFRWTKEGTILRLDANIDAVDGTRVVDMQSELLRESAAHA